MQQRQEMNKIKKRYGLKVCFCILTVKLSVLTFQMKYKKLVDTQFYISQGFLLSPFPNRIACMWTMVKCSPTASMRTRQLSGAGRLAVMCLVRNRRHLHLCPGKHSTQPIRPPNFPLNHTPT